MGHILFHMADTKSQMIKDHTAFVFQFPKSHVYTLAFSLKKGWSHITKLPQISESPALPNTGHFGLQAEIYHINCFSFLQFFSIFLLNKI